MPDHPNLLVIHTDQQSCWTLSAYGGTLVETPNIDRLGHEGASCGSSRDRRGVRTCLALRPTPPGGVGQIREELDRERCRERDS